MLGDYLLPPKPPPLRPPPLWPPPLCPPLNDPPPRLPPLNELPLLRLPPLNELPRLLELLPLLNERLGVDEDRLSMLDERELLGEKLREAELLLLRLDEKLREGLLKVPTEECELDDLLPMLELLLGALPILVRSPLLLLAPGVMRVLLSRLALPRKVLVPWLPTFSWRTPEFPRTVVGVLPLPKRLPLPLPKRPPLLLS